MKEFLKKDITIKIFSILFAIFLWFTINPVKTSDFTIPLTVINEDSLKTHGLVLNSKSIQKYVVVSVKERGSVLESIKDSDFEVTLDLSKVKSVDDKVIALEPPLYFGREKLNNNNIEVKPRTVQLDLAKIEENPFMVQIETYGKLAAGYEIISKTATPEEVSITAVESVLSNVGSVKVYVDVTNLNKSIEVTKECKVYNKKGEEMPDLAKKLTAEVKIEVGKSVSIVPIVKGEPANDFVEGEYSVKPDKILITGDSQIMAKTNELKTETISIDHATSTITTQALLQVPEGLKLVSSSREVTVVIEISPIEERVLQLPSANITMTGAVQDNSLLYEIVQPVTVKLRGLKEELDRITIEALNASIDVTKLEEGTHKVPLIMTIPATLSAEEVLVEVKITKPEANTNKDENQ